MAEIFLNILLDKSNNIFLLPKQITMKRMILLLCLLVTAYAQAQKMVIHGTVKDIDTKEILSFGKIILLNNNSHMVTDAEGKFSLLLSQPLANLKLKVIYPGYQTDTFTLVVGKSDYIIYLKSEQEGLNEVTVISGSPKAILISENPIAISGVSQKTIDKTIESNIIEALVKKVPGLNAVKTGPNISKPFIRGLGYNRVLTLYDGIRQEGQQWGDEHGIEVDAYAIDKAEVIKGPASLMYGSDALAGVVSMFPFRPANKDGKIKGRFLNEYHNNNGLTGSGLRLYNGYGQWYWITTGSYRLAKNYINRIDGRVYNTGFREINGTASAGYNSTKGYSNLTVTLYDNIQGIPDGSRDSLSRKFTRQTAEGASDDIKNRLQVSEAALNSYKLSPIHQHIQHYRIYTNNHYQTGKGEVETTIGFQQNIRREYSHPAAPQQAGLFVRLNTINYGVKYISTFFLNTEITVGFNGMYQNNRSKEATDFPLPDYHLLDLGTYLFGKWKQDKLTISAGLRYDTRELQSRDFYKGYNSATGFDEQVFLPNTPGAILQFPALQKNFSGVSVSLGLTYRLTKHLNLKANAARGYRSPNITEIASNGLDPGAHIIYLGNRNFIPEFSFQQDIGFIANFKDITGFLSVFNNHIQHYIYLTQLADAAGNAITDAQGNKTFQYHQASAQLYGLEASLELHPVTWNGFGFNNNIALVYGLNKKADYKNMGTEGEYLPLIPPAKWICDISQKLKINSKIITPVDLKAEMEYNAAQSHFLSLYNTETYTPAYTLINVSAGTQIKYAQNNTLQLQFQVNNLFDMTYKSNLSRLKYFEYYSRSPNGHLGIYGMGRNICAKIILGF